MSNYIDLMKHLEQIAGKGGPILMVTNAEVETGDLAEIITDNIGVGIIKADQSLVILESPSDVKGIGSIIIDANDLFDDEVNHKFHIFGVQPDTFVKLTDLAVELYGEEGEKMVVGERPKGEVDA